MISAPPALLGGIEMDVMESLASCRVWIGSLETALKSRFDISGSDKIESVWTDRISQIMTFESKLPLTNTFPPPSFAPAPPPAYLTTLTLPKWPCSLLVTVPELTSQIRTALSPPHEAKDALSGALLLGGISVVSEEVAQTYMSRPSTS